MEKKKFNATLNMNTVYVNGEKSHKKSIKSTAKPPD